MLFRILKTDIHWMVFYGLISVCWALVFILSEKFTEIQSFESVYGSEFWKDLCGQADGFEDILSLFFMWIIMSGAMMMPTLIPSLRTYQDLIHSGAGNSFTFTLLTFGFLSIWISYSVFAAVLQAFFIENNLVNMKGQFAFPMLSSALLLGAGLYQFSKIKNACVSKCRAPLTFFMEFWAPGYIPSYKMGLQLGLTCLGCCWMLMLMAFVGGTMSIVFMGLATLIMICEKLPKLGNLISKPLGWVLIVSGIITSVISVL